MKIMFLASGLILAAFVGGCAGPASSSGTLLTDKDIGISLALAQQDRDGFPHAFRITFENKSDHECILDLHGALPAARGYIIPSSIWFGFRTQSGRELTLTYTYGKAPKGERVRLKPGERCVREYPTADFWMWGPAADQGPNKEYSFARFFKPGKQDVRVQAVYVVASVERPSEEYARVLSQGITMRCSYDESVFANKGAAERVGTPLHQAVRQSDMVAAKRLIAQGEDVNAKDDYGRTPLDLAAQKGDVKIAEILLAAGANLNAEDDIGKSALHWAAHFGKVDVVKLLITKGADVNENKGGMGSPLHDAVGQGQTAAAVLLLASGADPNAKDNSGDGPLIYAARGGKEELAELLLGKGADLNAKGSAGWTPLHGAAHFGRDNIVQMLLARGADPNANDMNGWTPLAQAAMDGREKTAEMLLAHGADPNIRDKEGKTPLRFATEGGYKGLVEVLRQHGAKK
jgi:ankyrin repeat protein